LSKTGVQFEGVFGPLPDVARSLAQQAGFRHQFRFKNKLLSIDACTIELCASAFGWAQFHRTKGAVNRCTPTGFGIRPALRAYAYSNHDPSNNVPAILDGKG
jgi:hypothetical protein